MNNPEPFKITFNSHGREYSATLPWDANLEDIMDTIQGLLFAAGFAYEGIKDYVKLENNE